MLPQNHVCLCPYIVLACDKWQGLSQMPPISLGDSTGPGLLPMGNTDEFTLWSRAWALTFQFNTNELLEKKTQQQDDTLLK